MRVCIGLHWTYMSLIWCIKCIFWSSANLYLHCNIVNVWSRLFEQILAHSTPGGCGDPGSPRRCGGWRPYCETQPEVQEVPAWHQSDRQSRHASDQAPQGRAILRSSSPEANLLVSAAGLDKSPLVSFWLVLVLSNCVNLGCSWAVSHNPKDEYK